MSTADLGRNREYRVRDDMTDQGWSFIMRAAASKGAADLLMAHPDHGAALVQVGSRSKVLGPTDRERLCVAAELCSALALLAIVIPREPIRYWQVTREVPSRWEEWAACMTCEWCGEDVAFTSAETACGLDHCAECIGVCRFCQDDMRQEANR